VGLTDEPEERPHSSRGRLIALVAAAVALAGGGAYYVTMVMPLAG